MNYAEIKPNDIANGPGVRVSLFVSGCTHKCKGCFNEIAWDFNYGHEYTEEVMNHVLNLLSKPFIKGITFLGGEPLDAHNIPAVAETIRRIRNHPELGEKSIWVFTGDIYENLAKLAEKSTTNKIAADLKYIFKAIDVLVDGPFIEEKKNLMLRFRGSENQRLIDMKATLSADKVVLWDN